MAKTKFDKVSIAPDLTKGQHEDNKKLRTDADNKNKELDAEEALNWEFRTVGIRGQRRIIKQKKQQGTGRMDKRTRQSDSDDDSSPQRKGPREDQTDESVLES